mgnify:CR=1 FL=1
MIHQFIVVILMIEYLYFTCLTIDVLVIVFLSHTTCWIQSHVVTSLDFCRSGGSDQLLESSSHCNLLGTWVVEDQKWNYPNLFFEYLLPNLHLYKRHSLIRWSNHCKVCLVCVCTVMSGCPQQYSDNLDTLVDSPTYQCFHRVSANYVFQFPDQPMSPFSILCNWNFESCFVFLNFG